MLDSLWSEMYPYYPYKYVEVRCTPARMVVSTGEYQYIPRNRITDKIQGFIAPNLRENVCGFISSDQGFAFFNFGRNNHLQNLTEKLTWDFQNASSVKLTLIGGNLCGFFPWTDENRELKYLNQPSSMEQFREHSPKLYCWSYDVDDIVKECSKKVSDFFITYDYDMLDQKLAEGNYRVYDNNMGRFSFKLCDHRDFVGFQLFDKVNNALSGLFKEIKHYNNPDQSDVMVDFNGIFGIMPAFLLIDRKEIIKGLRCENLPEDSNKSQNLGSSLDSMQNEKGRVSPGETLPFWFENFYSTIM